MILKNKLGMILAFVMVILMVAVALLTGEKEIIFPEIAALVIGAWVAPAQPWETNRSKMFILMSVAAWAGVLLSGMVGIPLLVKVIVGFLITAVSLTVARCTMLPMISACILPILLGTTGVVYPIAVMLMTFIIVLVQKLMEQIEYRQVKTHIPCEIVVRDRLIKWGQLLVGFVLMAILATQTGYLFLIAPPLLVTFTELSEEQSPARKRPIVIWLSICIAALMGAMGARCVALLGDSYMIGIVAVLLLLVALMFYFLRILFPPTGAIALLPFILNPQMLGLYPILVCLGSGIFIGMALFIGRGKVDNEAEIDI